MESLQDAAARIIEEVKMAICDDYYRYPREYDEEKEGIELYMSEYCRNCPLNRL